MQVQIENLQNLNELERMAVDDSVYIHPNNRTRIEQTIFETPVTDFEILSLYENEQKLRLI